jgi:protein-S-isoprenylcysteine O-methyltransferase Ste14
MEKMMMNRLFALIYGVLIYAVFLATLAYAVCFIGDIAVPTTIDSGVDSPLLLAVAINVLLLGIFAIQHSVMARQGFKRVWTQVVPRHLERPTYVLAASLALLLLLWQWRPIPQLVWELHGAAATVLSVTFWLGWALLLASTFLINHFELFGLKQVCTYFGQKEHRGGYVPHAGSLQDRASSALPGLCYCLLVSATDEPRALDLFDRMHRIHPAGDLLRGARSGQGSRPSLPQLPRTGPHAGAILQG